jgi:hypothetical protein
MIRLLSFLFFIVISGHAVAQTENSNYEISQLFHQRAYRFNCSSVKKEIERIRSLSQEDFENELGEEVILLKKMKIQAANQKEEDNLGSDLEVISRMMSTGDGKKKRGRILSGLESICQKAKNPILFFARNLSMANSTLLQSLAFPFSGIYHFFDGILNRKKQQLGDRLDVIHHTLGVRTSLNRYTLGFLASEALSYIHEPGPLAFSLRASFAMEMITHNLCLNRDKTNEDHNSFCDDFFRLRDFFHERHARSFNAGKKIQAFLDRKIMEKRKDLSTEDFCSLSRDIQIRRAYSVLQRHKYLSEDPNVAKTDILFPIHKNSCTKIVLHTNSAHSSRSAKYQVIEGVEIIVLNRDEFPGEYYFNSEELENMTSDESLCYEVESLHYGIKLDKKIPQLGDLAKSKLAPEILSIPLSSDFIMKDHLLRRGRVDGLRNVVFLLSKSDNDLENARVLRKSRNRIKKVIKPHLTKVLRSNNYFECRSTLIKEKINSAVLKGQLLEFSTIQNAEELEFEKDYYEISNNIKYEQSRLKLKWELIVTNSLDDIVDHLKSSDVGNVIFVGKGKKSGEFIGPGDQKLSQEIFAQISPSIQSINFYSSFGQQTLVNLGLAENIQAQPSYHKMRYLSSVSLNDFMSEESFAPAEAFNKYLLKLDLHLWKSMKGSRLMQQEFGHRFESSP